MCGCETWYNFFRRIFGCRWRESVSCLLFYCQTLPLSYMVDQNIILFWKKALNCDNNIIRTLAEYGLLLSISGSLGCFYRNIIFLQLTLLSVTSDVVYGNTSSTWHTTVEKYSSVRTRACTFSLLLLCFNF